MHAQLRTTNGKNADFIVYSVSDGKSKLGNLIHDIAPRCVEKALRGLENYGVWTNGKIRVSISSERQKGVVGKMGPRKDGRMQTESFLMGILKSAKS